MLSFTSEQLIDSVRRTARLPDSGSRGSSDQDILNEATEILWAKFVPHLLKVREKYFAVSERIPLVNNVSRYAMPPRALLDKLSSLWWVEAGGNRHPLGKVEQEDLHLFNDFAGEPRRHYVEGNDIVILPAQANATGHLEVCYFLRPGNLVPSTSARQVTAVGANTITVATNPSWANNTLLDVHSPESGAVLKSWRNRIVSQSGSGPVIFTMEKAVDGTLFGTRAVEVGDWLCLTGEAVVPGLPREFQSLLALATSMRYATITGATDQVKIWAQEMTADMKALVGVAENRVESKPLKISGRGGMLSRITGRR